MPTKKTPAQLQREIDEALSRGSGSAPMSDRDKIRAAIAQFPATFGLRGFPGGVFRLSPDSSYVSGGRVALYTQRKDGDSWNDFSKGTEAELRGQIVADKHGRSHSEMLKPTAEARRQVQTIQHREQFPEIIAISMRADGTNYTVKIPDAKSKHGYDLVDVLVHHSGLRSIKSASRSRTTPDYASRIVTKYLNVT
jgi:hypothetical protein